MSLQNYYYVNYCKPDGDPYNDYEDMTEGDSIQDVLEYMEKHHPGMRILCIRDTDWVPGPE